jgi:hypothetical protein
MGIGKAFGQPGKDSESAPQHGEAPAHWASEVPDGLFRPVQT